MASRAGASTIAIAACVAVAAGLAWAGSTPGARVLGLPLFAACGALAFAVNWIAFVPSCLARSERYYDLTGSATYLAVVTLALGGAPQRDARAWLLAGVVAIWALRLGSFLFLRILSEGADRRFDRIKQSPSRFALAWTLQALWVFVTVSCALAAITTPLRRPLGAAAGLGLGIWLVGLVIEAVADDQKRRFRSDPARSTPFIMHGLWAWSRHPNYFGEILVWIGVAIVALPVLEGGRLVTLVSPFFVFVLLTRISGIPLLERRADDRWGDLEAYQRYKARTPVLFPRPPDAGAPDATADR